MGLLILLILALIIYKVVKVGREAEEKRRREHSALDNLHYDLWGCFPEE